ncbi:hypothetical protein LCM28_09840 [Salipiger pacificus]|nr:hypothetical protein [Alloyangia pacifica]
MPNIFYTYVWGSSKEQGGPLVFQNERSRSVALNRLQEGDLVFGICATNPKDPRVVILEDQKGRVLGCWQMSRETARSDDFGLRPVAAWEYGETGGFRWPFAVIALRNWRIDSPPLFRDLDGYVVTPEDDIRRTHSQEATATIVQVNDTLAASLIQLRDRQGVEMEMLPHSLTIIEEKLQAARQRHPSRLSGYSVPPREDSQECCVYIAQLGAGKHVANLKVGHTTDHKQRLLELNKYRIASEKQWVLRYAQPYSSISKAVEIEAKLGEHFVANRTQPHNGELYSGVTADDVFHVMDRL